MTTQTTYSLLRHGHVERTVGVPIVVWLAVLAVAWSYLMLHDFSTTVDVATAPIVSNWPDQSAIARNESGSTLMLFLHPKCPCSRATVRELERVLATSPVDDAQLILVATIPHDATEQWADTATLRAAQQLLPNATVVVDRAGEETERFGATTSGQLALFDSAGRRVFAGGITPSRGHEGANPGADQLTALLRGEPTQTRDFPAYGCQLCLPHETTRSQGMPLTAAN